MKNKKITRKITQGMYLLTTVDGGCIVDAVSQVSAGDNPYIAVAVMKKNVTNELVKKNRKFALSVLGKNTKPEVIQTFGYKSMRDLNKFDHIKMTQEMGLPVLKDSLGIMICEVVDSIENETHTLFIGKLIDGDVYKEEEAMSYSYYQEHKEEYIEMKTEKGQTAWICTVCGYIYYGDNVPADFKCPICQVSADLFTLYNK